MKGVVSEIQISVLVKLHGGRREADEDAGRRFSPGVTQTKSNIQLTCSRKCGPKHGIKKMCFSPHIEELYCPIEIKIVASSACSLLMCYLRGAMRAIISPRREFNYKPWFGRAWSMRANTLGAGLKT